MNHLPEIHALWIGNQLGAISASCLASFIKRGHSVYLHSYQNIIDLPIGVNLLNANEIIPENQIIRHKKTGSYALFSDIYRYQLLKKRSGIVYVDCDVYCIKPIILPAHGYLFGYETNDSINGAILAMPSDGELLSQLITATQNPTFEWITPKSRQMRYQLLFKLFGFEHMTWGTVGPKSLTYFIQKLNLNDWVQDFNVFYPIHFGRLNQLLNPYLNIQDLVNQNTIAIHLYNEYLKKLLKLNDLNPNCVLAQMLRLEI